MAAAQWADAFFRIELVAQAIGPGAGRINHYRSAQADAFRALWIIE